MKIINEDKLHETNWNTRQKKKEAVNNLLKNKPQSQNNNVSQDRSSNINQFDKSSDSLIDTINFFNNTSNPYKDRAGAAREILHTSCPQSGDNPEILNRTLGTNTFVDWFKAFKPEEAADPKNDFITLLNNINGNTLQELLKDNSFFKLYNSYANGYLEKITPNYVRDNDSVIFKKELYNRSEDDMNHLIQVDVNPSHEDIGLNNVSKETKKQILYTEDGKGKLRTWPQVEKIISNITGKQIKNTNSLVKTWKNSSKDQKENFIRDLITSSEENRKFVQNIINDINNTKNKQ